MEGRPKGWVRPARGTAGKYYIDFLGLLDLAPEFRNKFRENASHWVMWRAVEVHIRMSENSVVLHHSMRFKDPDGTINSGAPLPQLLNLMRRATVIPPDLYRTVVIDRCITPDNAADFVRQGFTPEATLHLAQGWNFVHPMLQRMTAQLARRAEKMLFIVPASVTWCPPQKSKADKTGKAMDTVCPPVDVLRGALFRDNSNATGERMGLLPLFEGQTVEIL